MVELKKRLYVISSFLFPIIAHSTGYLPLAPLVPSTPVSALHAGRPACINCILASVWFSQLGAPEEDQRKQWEEVGLVTTPVMLTLVNFIPQLKVTASMHPGFGNCPSFSLQSCG